MKIVQPIKDSFWQKEFEDYFQSTNQRNYVLYMSGVYLGLRITDLLSLRVTDVKGTHLIIKEGKTGKTRRMFIHHRLRKAYDEYTKDMKGNELLFLSRKRSRTGKKRPIGRKAADDILKKAAKELGYTEAIATHSLRKTFGYKFHREYNDLEALQTLFNHKSQKDTIRYIGIEQEDLDDKVANMR